jgi:DNA-binding response OmpR family regulator
MEPMIAELEKDPLIFDEPETGEEPAQLCNVGNIRILVIDDDSTIGRLIQSALAQHDFIVEAVSEPLEIERQLQKEDYHLIILDYVLPGLDSAQVIDWIQLYQADTRIIVVTGYPSMDSALHCLRAHTFDYLTKPFAIENLRSSVLRCLESRGLVRLSPDALRLRLGVAIRERRKALGLTLAEMARRTEVSLGYLSQIELGRNSASIETLYRIALGLQLRLAELFQTLQTSP